MSPGCLTRHLSSSGSINSSHKCNHHRSNGRAYYVVHWIQTPGGLVALGITSKHIPVASRPYRFHLSPSNLFSTICPCVPYPSVLLPTFRSWKKSVVLLILSLPLGFNLYGLYSHFRSLNSNAIFTRDLSRRTGWLSISTTFSLKDGRYN